MRLFCLFRVCFNQELLYIILSKDYSWIKLINNVFIYKITCTPNCLYSKSLFLKFTWVCFLQIIRCKWSIWNETSLWIHPSSHMFMSLNLKRQSEKVELVQGTFTRGQTISSNASFRSWCEKKIPCLPHCAQSGRDVAVRQQLHAIKAGSPCFWVWPLHTH